MGCLVFCHAVVQKGLEVPSSGSAVVLERKALNEGILLCNLTGTSFSQNDIPLCNALRLTMAACPRATQDQCIMHQNPLLSSHGSSCLTLNVCVSSALSLAEKYSSRVPRSLFSRSSLDMSLGGGEGGWGGPGAAFSGSAGALLEGPPRFSLQHTPQVQQ